MGVSEDVDVYAEAPVYSTSASTSTGTRTGTSTSTRTGTTGGTSADMARMAASSLTTADHLAGFFERNKIAVIATGSILLAGGIAAIYLSTRDGEL